MFEQEAREAFTKYHTDKYGLNAEDFWRRTDGQYRLVSTQKAWEHWLGCWQLAYDQGATSKVAQRDADAKTSQRMLMQSPGMYPHEKCPDCRAAGCEPVAQSITSTVAADEQAGYFLCAAQHSDTGANDPQDCDWPFCGCDTYADKVLEALQESGKTYADGFRDGQESPRIYAASRASLPERPAMWRELRKRGVNIVSSWIDESGEGETEDFGELWERITQEIASADRLVLYAEESDFPLKGAILEAGIALGMGKPVIVVLPRVELKGRTFRPIGSWIAHPLVQRVDDIEQAIDALPLKEKP